MKTYDTSDLTDEDIVALRKKIRDERWVWTCNGMVLPHDEPEFTFRRKCINGDVIGLLFRERPSRCDIPVMG